MNQKSKAFELIEFVWNNEKTDSYVRVNTTMYKAVILAIISQMEFNKNDLNRHALNMLSAVFRKSDLRLFSVTTLRYSSFTKGKQ